jgi:hypothetical protein
MNTGIIDNLNKLCNTFLILEKIKIKSFVFKYHYFKIRFEYFDHSKYCSIQVSFGNKLYIMHSFGMEIRHIYKKKDGFTVDLYNIKDDNIQQINNEELINLNYRFYNNNIFEKLNERLEELILKNI